MKVKKVRVRSLRKSRLAPIVYCSSTAVLERERVCEKGGSVGESLDYRTEPGVYTMTRANRNLHGYFEETNRDEEKSVRRNAFGGDDE